VDLLNVTRAADAGAALPFWSRDIGAGNLDASYVAGHRAGVGHLGQTDQAANWYTDADDTFKGRPKARTESHQGLRKGVGARKCPKY
jgi:hypothetical protein